MPGFCAKLPNIFERVLERVFAVEKAGCHHKVLVQMALIRDEFLVSSLMGWVKEEIFRRYSLHLSGHYDE